MIFIVGGVAAGKRRCAKRILGLTDTDIVDCHAGFPAPESQAVCFAEELVRARDLSSEQLDALAAFPCVIMTEVGAGIVPVDAQDAAWRERAGRLGCELAERSSRVLRVVCGVSNVIKEGTVQ